MGGSSDFLERLKRLNASGPFNPRAQLSAPLVLPAIEEAAPEQKVQEPVPLLPTLPSLWAHASAVKNDKSDNFVSLKIKSDKRPISLLEGNGWLAWVQPEEEKGIWAVGVWKSGLANLQMRESEDGVAARSILNFVKGLRPEAWVLLDIPFSAPPVAKPHEPRPPAFG